jgi:hypothetical protein
MDPQTVFTTAVNELMATLWPTVGPHEIIKFHDNLVDNTKYTALVLIWDGVTNNAVTKKLYKLWLVDGVLTYAEVAKTEWPIGI